MTLFRSVTLFQFGSYRCVRDEILRTGFPSTSLEANRQRKGFGSKGVV